MAHNPNPAAISVQTRSMGAAMSHAGQLMMLMPATADVKSQTPKADGQRPECTRLCQFCPNPSRPATSATMVALSPTHAVASQPDVEAVLLRATVLPVRAIMPTRAKMRQEMLSRAVETGFPVPDAEA